MSNPRTTNIDIVLRFNSSSLNAFHAYLILSIRDKNNRFFLFYIFLSRFFLSTKEILLITIYSLVFLVIGKVKVIFVP